MAMAGPPSPLHQPLALRSRLSSVPPPLSSADPILFYLPFRQGYIAELLFKYLSQILASTRTTTTFCPTCLSGLPLLCMPRPLLEFSPSVRCMGRGRLPSSPVCPGSPILSIPCRFDVTPAAAGNQPFCTVQGSLDVYLKLMRHNSLHLLPGFITVRLS